jgi:hypothetical protein
VTASRDRKPSREASTATDAGVCCSRHFLAIGFAAVLSLFIDTNVYLSFYAFSQDDLTRLQRLAEQVERGEVQIFKTSQLEDEFRRNRENKIHSATKDLRGRRLD